VHVLIGFQRYVSGTMGDDGPYVAPAQFAEDLD
jgi:hypothetical protein